jgi:hypothetical protein
MLMKQLTVLNEVCRRAVHEGFEIDDTDIIDDPALFDIIDEDERPLDETSPDNSGHSDTVAEVENALMSPEYTQLPLPSNWSSENNNFRPVELDLRIKQAAKTLQTLRDAIADKSFQFSHVIRVAPRKGVRTRARATVATLNHRIAYLARVYRCCRAAMVRLSASEPTLTQYQILLPEHLKSSTAILNPNEPGSTRLQLSWIWQTGAADSSNSHAALRECKSIPYPALYRLFLTYLVNRVHWLQARAQRDRWREEFTLVGYEMEWTMRYFMHEAEVWEGRRRVAVHDDKAGAAAYAARKRHTWREMAAAADTKFMGINNSYRSVLKN